MRLKQLFFLFIILLMGCNSTPQSTEPTIMVTIEPLKYFTESIVGKHFKIVSMVPKGTSPETYDPTPQQLMDLAKCQAYLRIGYIGFELNWMSKLKGNTPNLKIYDTSKGVDLIYAKDHDHGDHHHHGGIEPHIWNSTQNAKIIAHNILQSVIQLDSIHKDVYTENYQTLISKIEDTDIEIRNILKEDTSYHGFMIYHPALSYFARDYELTQVSIEEEGKEPTPAHLKHLIQTCKEQDIHIIFIQPEFDTRNAEIIAQQTQSKVISIEPLSYDWHGQMLHVAKALRKDN